jgi:hypothetical protein
MTMNVWKGIVICILGAACGGSQPEARVAGGAPVCRNQPNMNAAIVSLRDARSALDRAEHDKGGWRVAAIRSTDDAIRETERGCAFAD